MFTAVAHNVVAERCIVFSPDGRYCVTRCWSTISIYDMSKDECVDRIRNVIRDTIYEGCWVGNTIVLISRHPHRLFVLHTNGVGKILGHAWRGFNHPVYCPAVSPCEQFICVRHSIRRRGAKNLPLEEETRILSVAIVNNNFSIARHFVRIQNLLFASWSPDGKILAGCMAPNRTKIVMFNTTTDEWWRHPPHCERMPLDADVMRANAICPWPQVREICWSREGSWLAVSCFAAVAGKLTGKLTGYIAITNPQGVLQRLFFSVSLYNGGIGWLDDYRFVEKIMGSNAVVHDVAAVNDRIVARVNLQPSVNIFCLKSKIATTSSGRTVAFYVPTNKWTPRLHLHFDYGFQKRVFAVLCCDVQLPLEILFEIFELMLLLR